jgi:hypothetical protein
MEILVMFSTLSTYTKSAYSRTKYMNDYTTEWKHYSKNYRYKIRLNKRVNQPPLFLIWTNCNRRIGGSESNPDIIVFNFSAYIPTKIHSHVPLEI